MSGAGHSASQAVLAGTMFWVGGILGNLALGWFVDRRGFGPVLSGTFFVGVIAIVAIGQVAGSLTVAFLVVGVAGFCVLGAQSGLNALGPTYYPVSVRSTGTGWASKPEPSTHGPARAQIHANWVVYFYEVVRCGSVRAAARKLNVAPSAISRQIKDLEAQLGTQLLEKKSARSRPTAAGEAVARHASNVIKDLSYTRAVVADLNGLRRGHVSIVAAQATSTDFLPHAISELKNRFPRVSFDCDFTGTANIVPRLIDGTADVGVAFQSSSDSRVRNVISVPLPFGVIVHADHCLAKNSTVRLSDFEDELVILPDHSISYRMVLDRMIEGRSFQFRSTVTSSEPTFIVSLVRYGAGVAFGTPIGVERDLNEGSLVFVPLQDRHLKPPALTVTVAADRALSPLASVVVERFRNDAALLLRRFVPES